MLGINQSDLCQLDAKDLDRVCADIRSYGFRSVRFAVDWGLHASWTGKVNYVPVQRVAAALARHDLTGLPVVGIHYPLRKSPAAFGAFTRAVVDIFGPVPAYEVWNEPNLWAFGVGTPAQFLPYLRAAAPEIRAVGAKVIHGGLAAYPDHRVLWIRNYAPTTWLRELRAAGEDGDYDVLGYHPYSITEAEKWVDPGTRPFGIRQLDAITDWMLGNGDARPLALTEIGYDTAKISFATAAQYLTEQATNLAHPGWLFCWRDTPGDGGNYGIVTRTGTPKPALHAAVRNLIR